MLSPAVALSEYSSPLKPSCSECLASLEPTKGAFKCSRCLSVYYCNEDCQAKHWRRGHKEDCRNIYTLNQLNAKLQHKTRQGLPEYHEESTSSSSSSSSYTFQGPFEWLTDYTHLAPYFDPVHLFPPMAAVDATPRQDESSVVPKSDSMYVLHIGAGTSTLGEDLAAAHPSHYSLVVNVDTDRSALRGMEQRYQTLHSSSSTLPKPRVVWRYFDFCTKLKTIENVPLDSDCTIVHSPLRQILYNVMYSSSDDTMPNLMPNMDKSFHSNLYYDLILDKGTLDCALTQDDADQDAVAHLLCHVYAALRPPTTHFRLGDDSPGCNSPPVCRYRGGVYVCVSLHPMEFLLPLLQNLPCNDWIVQATPIVNPSTSTNTNLFICQRVCSACHFCTTRRPAARMIGKLDAIHVRDHVRYCTHRYFTQENPTITPQREEKIRRAFDEYERKHSEMRTSLEPFLVPLDACYSILLSEDEQECISYMDFSIMWTEYTLDDGYEIRAMSVETALNFVKSLQ